MIIRRMRRGDVAPLTILLQGAPSAGKPSSDQVRDRFFARSYLLVEEEGEIRGMLGWEIANLVAWIQDVHAFAPEGWATYLLPLLDAVEHEARILHGEVAFLSLPADPSPAVAGLLQNAGYRLCALDEIRPLWRASARERIMPEQSLWIKQLH